MELSLDNFLKKNPNWEVVSVSHALIPGAVSAAVVLKYTGASHEMILPPAIE